jgi:hypothetical protein
MDGTEHIVTAWSDGSLLRRTAHRRCGLRSHRRCRASSRRLPDAVRLLAEVATIPRAASQARRECPAETRRLWLADDVARALEMARLATWFAPQRWLGIVRGIVGWWLQRQTPGSRDESAADLEAFVRCLADDPASMRRWEWPGCCSRDGRRPAARWRWSCRRLRVPSLDQAHEFLHGARRLRPSRAVSSAGSMTNWSRPAPTLIINTGSVKTTGQTPYCTPS